MEIGLKGTDRSAAELAGLLGLSRESVHQLLSPYVRSGLLVAVRDRALRDLPYVPLYSPDALYGVRTGIAFTPRLDRAVFATDLRRTSR